MMIESWITCTTKGEVLAI